MIMITVMAIVMVGIMIITVIVTVMDIVMENPNAVVRFYKYFNGDVLRKKTIKYIFLI